MLHVKSFLKKIEYLIVLGVQLDNGVHPLGEEASKDVNM